MSLPRVLLKSEDQEEAYARLREWFQRQPEYDAFLEKDNELGKRLLPQFVQLEQRRSDLPDEDIFCLAFGAIELLENAFTQADQLFLKNWDMIYRDFYAAKWKMGDLQGIVGAYLADRLLGRAQCLSILSLYHNLAEGPLHHLMLALWVALQTEGKRLVKGYQTYKKKDPAELISLFKDDHDWAKVLDSLYERDLRIAFAHIRYEMGKHPDTISLELGGKDVELDSSALGKRFLRLFGGVTSLGFGIEAFFLRNDESFDISSLGLKIDPAQYLNLIQNLMAIRGLQIQVQPRRNAATGLEISAVLSPIREKLLDADIKQFADTYIGEIICYLDFYISFQAESIHLVLIAKDNRQIGEWHFGSEKLKRIRESTQNLVKDGFLLDIN